MAEEI